MDTFISYIFYAISQIFNIMLFVNWAVYNFLFKIIVLVCCPSSIIFILPFCRNIISSFFHLLHNQYMVNKKMIWGI